MIGIVDYGMGNLGSMTNACAFLELDARIIESPEKMDACEAVILPGVGAFGDCMRHLDSHDFVDPLRNWIAEDRPFLGICLGLQVLFDTSEESPDVSGLGVLTGTVRRFAPAPGRKVPQNGWNRVRQTVPNCPLFRGIDDETFFYFVHSYFADAGEERVVAGTTNYGVPYASAVWRGRLMAVQFHPEKSQRAGLRLLRNFNGLVTTSLYSNTPR